MALISLAQWQKLVRSTNVRALSRQVFGIPYESLAKLLYPRPRYRTFFLTKRSGAQRQIDEPRKRIKLLQEKAVEFLKEFAEEPKPCVQGFTKERSIVTNARKHLGYRTRFLLNIDLEDFFPSITFFRVRGLLMARPFHFSYEVATVLGHLFTLDNSLPQGAPSSPFLSNLVCRSMDRDLMALARRHRATYTRYADDLTFSFSVRNAENLPGNICGFDAGVVKLGHELESIIQDTHHFKINPAKSRIASRQSRLDVTGITINQFPNVRRKFIDTIRGGLHAWATYGYAKAQEEWARMIEDGAAAAYEKRPWKRQTRTGHAPALQNVLWGKLLYLRMVRGEGDAIYTRLAEKYNALCELEKIKGAGVFLASGLPVEPVVRNAQDAERAVFVLEWSGDYKPDAVTSEFVGAQATVFVYGKSGLLVTCEHALKWNGAIGGKSVTVDMTSEHVVGAEAVVSRPGVPAQWAVEVVARDIGRDLAVLKFKGPAPAHRYFTSSESAIKRHSRGTLIGFPNWHPGKDANQVQTSVINTYPRSGLDRLEIGTLIRQGNSGGPFVDELYRVAGVAQEGAKQDQGNDECICVTELDAWLTSLEL